MQLCDACKPMKFVAVMSIAKCGHGTTQGGMMWCAECAKKHGACASCGKALSGSYTPPEDPPPHTD